MGYPFTPNSGSKPGYELRQNKFCDATYKRNFLMKPADVFFNRSLKLYPICIFCSRKKSVDRNQKDERR